MAHWVATFTVLLRTRTGLTLRSSLPELRVAAKAGKGRNRGRLLAGQCGIHLQSRLDERGSQVRNVLNRGPVVSCFNGHSVAGQVAWGIRQDYIRHGVHIVYKTTSFYSCVLILQQLADLSRDSCKKDAAIAGGGS
jgi:hypothetical protein